MKTELKPDDNGFVRIIGCKQIGIFFENWVTYELALTLVREKGAAIVTENTIVKLFNKRQLKRYVLERDNWTCHYCGMYGDTVDHVVPRSKGGRSTPLNLVCACEPCNKAKGTTDYEIFIKLLA